MITKGFKTQIAKATVAVMLAAALPTAAMPATALAEPGPAGAKAEESLSMSVEELLAAGEYEEGRVLVLCDSLAGSAEEELVGAGESAALSMATVVDTVSGKSYMEASGKELDPVNEEEPVGSSYEGDMTDSCDEDRISVLLIEDPERTTRELLAEVLNDPAVLYAQPDYMHEMDSFDDRDAGSADDPAGPADDPVEEEADSAADTPEPSVGTVTIPDLTGWQWEHAGSALIPQTDIGPESIYNVHAPLWNQTGATNSEGVVAVLDTGVDYTHPDLKGVMYEFSPELQEMLSCGPYGINTSGDGDPYDPMDYNGHGTHCSGIIAGEWDGAGISGAASGCRLMAIRMLNDKNQISDLAVVNGMAFVADAVDKGVDVRVTSNSYSGEITNVLIAAELAELKERGVVTVYSSGNSGSNNEISNSTSNMLGRASNAVVVNASTALYHKGGFSSYSEGMTDLFAPGASILSTMTTQSTADGSKSYAASLDPAAYHYNTTFEDVPTVTPETDSGIELGCEAIGNSYSFDADGKMLGIKLDKMEEEVSAFSFEMDIPVGSQTDVPYVSLAMYVPGGQCEVGISRAGTGKDGEEVRVRSSGSTLDGNWTFLSCTEAPDLVAKGASFPVVTHDGDPQNYVPIVVSVYRPYGLFREGEIICMDQIGAGANADALLPYIFWDGTSMACPEVSAEAVILYNGLERSKANAVEIVRKIRSKVVSGEDFEKCSSHGTMDMAVTEDRYVPVVENAVCDRAEKTITITGCNFGSNGSVTLSDTATEIESWTSDRIVVRCPEAMDSGVHLIRVTNSIGSGSGSFLLYAPDGSQDSATPLYETEIPEIPENLYPEGGLVDATIGLNDRIYVFVADLFTHEHNYGSKVLCYSVTDRIWERIPDMPISLCDISVTGYRGKLLVTGSQTIGEEFCQKILEYSPTKGAWTIPDLPVPLNTAIINVNGTVYSVGGREYIEATETDRAMTDIQILDIPAGKVTVAGSLQTGIENGYVASDGKAIYLSGGYTRTDGKGESSTERLQKITLNEDGTATAEEVESPFTYPASMPYYIREFITGYQKVYLTGYVGAAAFEDEPALDAATGDEMYTDFDEATDLSVATSVGTYTDSDEATDLNVVTGVRTYVDPDGMNILDADTFVLTEDHFLPYEKRIAHDTLYMVQSTEYKGELYAFGFSIFEGDDLIDLVGRSTTVGEANAPVWDTFAIKIPEANDLAYTGSPLTGVPGSAEGYYTVTGNVGTDPGTYTATLALTDPDRCIWEDGTTEDKVLTWKITGGPTVTAAPTVTAVPTVTERPTITARPKGSTEVSSKSTTQNAAASGTSATAASATASKTSSGTTARATSNVKTGDTSRPFLWICVAAVALVLIAVVLRRRKK